MILFVGPPGAGKSVQAQLLENEANVKWLSMGKVLREKMSGELKEQMDRGELLDDSVVQEIFADAVHAISNGTRVLIDGFPRRNSQVEWFLGYVRGAKRNLEAIIHLQISEEEAEARLIPRGRLDDKTEIIMNRYEQYKTEIIPMLDQLREKNLKICDINGERPIEEVHAEIMSQLKGVI